LIFKHAISTVVIMKAGHAFAGANQAAHSAAAAAPRSAEPVHSEASDS